MCGICGAFDFSDTHSVIPIHAMTEAIRHRGPDDEGYLLVNTHTGENQELSGNDTNSAISLPDISSVSAKEYNLAFGNRRLAILDTSSAGHNPMQWSQGKYWITYNGEIYNYMELREELKDQGFRFESETDTEVLLAAYDAWGADCLSRFNGMFAFVIWDKEKNRLFCARDRLGIKPFHYYWDGSLFVFGSEIKALLAHPSISSEANDRIVYEYIINGSLDHSDESFFANIVRLPPGQFLILNMNDRDFHIEPYWKLEANPDLGIGQQPNVEKVEEFGELFSDAVRLRLRSDVPIGTALSGGIDSSSIVWAVNKIMRSEYAVPAEIIGQRQKTFSAVFDDQRIDERPYLEQVVELAGVDGHQVAPQGNALWEEAQRIQFHQDEPFSSSSIFAQWNVMRLAKANDVTVLLDGQGADEILAGYTYYLGSYLAELIRGGNLSAYFKKLNALADSTESSQLYFLMLSVYNALPAGLSRIFMGLGNQFLRKNSTLSKSDLQSSFASRNRGFVGGLKTDPQAHFGQHLQESVVRHSLPALLRYEDRNSMAFGIEARVPFLDHRLVEWIFALSANYRLHQSWTKWILRNHMDGQLPDEVVWRRKKIGFETPEKQWLHDGQAWIANFFDQPKANLALNYVTPSIIEKLIQDPTRPGSWRLINLELWLRSFA